MRNIYLLLLSLVTFTGVEAQTTLVNSNFESGDLTNWQFANASTNKWAIGSATAASGTKSAYISQDNGVTYSYSNSNSEASHIYVAINVPAGETAIILNFDWKGVGEHLTTATWDYIRVSVRSTIPTSNTLPTTAEQIPVAFNAGPNFTNASVVLPASLAGAGTRYLVFTWNDDGSGGTNPPGAIDNVVVTSAVPSPLTGTKTIGPSGDYSNFGKAIAALNANGVGSNGVTFNVTPGTVFNETPLALTATGTPANPIVFQKNGAGANPLIIATGTGNWGPTLATQGSSFSNISDGIIVINGGDYITFDGIDVKTAEFTAGSTAIEYGYLIRNASATDGAKNIVIKNATITMNRAYTTTVGLLQTSGSLGGGVNATNISGANESNQYYNIQVYNSFSGIFFNGGTSTAGLLDQNNVLSTLPGGQTIVGAAYTGIPNGDIGAGGTTFGIQAANQSNISISFVTVRNVTSSGTNRGIYVLNAQGPNNNVYNNQVYGIRNTSTSSTSGQNAFELTLSSTGTHTLNAFNNFAYDITSAYTGSASSTRQMKGILLGSGAATSIYNVNYNSIRIDGSGSPNISNVCLETGGSTTILNVRNNIMANFTGAQTGVAVHACIRTTSATTFGASGSGCDYNDYYVANTTNGFVGIANATNGATIATWKSGFTTPPAASIDGNSISVDPMFISPTNLHISPAWNNVDAKATPLTITTDIDGDARDASTPDIGADEYAFLIGTDVGVVSMTAPAASGCYTAAEPVTVVIKNQGSSTANFSTNNVTVTVTTSTGYNSSFVVNSGSLPSGGVLTVTMPATINMTIPATYTFNATTSVAGGDVNPGNDALTPQITRLVLGGTYTVGVGGNYTNLTAALNDFNATTCIVSPITYKLTNTYSSSGETFPITFNVNPANGSNPLTVRPDAGATPVITGNSALAIIKLNGADNVIIDGSNSGGTDRSLTIENQSTTTSGNAVVWIASQALGNGANNNTIKNCIIQGSSSTAPLSGIHIGGSTTIGITTAGLEKNSNNTLNNNLLRKSQYGILFFGYGAATPDDNNVVSNNTVGTATAGEGFNIAGIWADRQSGLQVTGNDVQNVQGTSTSAMFGIRLLDFKNGQALRNKVHNIRYTGTSTAARVYGMGLSSSTYTTAGNPSNAVVANNFVYDVTTSGTSTTWNLTGMLAGAGYGDKFYYNSIHLTGQLSNSTNTPLAAAFANGDANLTTTSTNPDIRDNIFSIAGVGAASGTGNVWAYYSKATSTSTSTIQDYNDFYTNSTNATNNVAFYNNTSYVTLADWRAASGLDMNSIAVDPVFVSPTDLHISPTANAVDAKGTPVSVTNDIDGNTRHASTPDIGADEYLLVVGNDLGVFSLLTPLASGCYTNAEPVSVLIKNYGSIPVDFGTYSVTVSVTASNGYSSSTNLNSGVIAPNSTLMVTMPSTIDMSTNGTIVFNATTSVLGGDVNNANNNLSPAVSRTVLTMGGDYTVGVGGNYTTLTAAVNDFNNASCVTGPVTFRLTSTYTSNTETFPITINVNPANGANPLTIRPDNGTTATVSGSSGTALIKLNGADNVVIDGSNSSGTDRSLTLENTSSTGGATVIWLASQGLGLGATNNTIKNVKIKGGVAQNASTTVTNGIVISGSTLGTSVTGQSAGNDNDNNTITNNEFTKLRFGIISRGGGTTNPNLQNVFSNNTIGPSAFGADEIGVGGITLREEENAMITGNEIRFIGGDFANTTSGTDRVGISLATDFTWTPTSVYAKNIVISKNKIHDIVDERTFSASAIILAGTDGTNPTNNVVSNNMIYNVKANGTSGDQTAIIGVAAGVADQIVYNSIYSAGDVDPNPSATACSVRNFGVFVTAATDLTIKNNIIVNDLFSSSAPTIASVDIGTPASFSWGAGGSDYNDLYVNPSNTIANVGSKGSNTAGTLYPTLAGWQSASGSDNHSINKEPGFVSPTDLHISQYVTWVDGKATPISITDDIDNDTRNPGTPDIGADEYVGIVGADVGVVSLINPPASGGCYGATETVTVQIKNFGSVDIDMSINPVVVFVTASPYGYNSNVVLNSGIFVAGTTMNITMPFPIDMSNPASYTFNASTSVIGGDINPSNDNLTPAVTRVTSFMNGTYTVGTGGDYTNLTQATTAYNSACITGNVTFMLTNAYNSSGETFPINITGNATQGTNTLLIRPAAGFAAAITGASSANALIRIRNKFVTIDGINSGGTSLTLQNTGTGAGSTVVWINSTAAGNGASNNTIKNVSIKGGVDQNSSTTATFGIVISGGTALGTTVTGQTAGNDNDNITVTGNTFTKLRFAIVSRGGSTTNPNLGNIFSNNTIGPSSFGVDEIGQGGINVREEENVTISQNEVRFVGGDYDNTTSGADRVGIALASDFAWLSSTLGS